MKKLLLIVVMATSLNGFSQLRNMEINSSTKFSDGDIEYGTWYKFKLDDLTTFDRSWVVGYKVNPVGLGDWILTAKEIVEANGGDWSKPDKDKSIRNNKANDDYGIHDLHRDLTIGYAKVDEMWILYNGAYKYRIVVYADDEIYAIFVYRFKK